MVTFVHPLSTNPLPMSSSWQAIFSRCHPRVLAQCLLSSAGRGRSKCSTSNTALGKAQVVTYRSFHPPPSPHLLTAGLSAILGQMRSGKLTVASTNTLKGLSREVHYSDGIRPLQMSARTCYFQFFPQSNRPKVSPPNNKRLRSTLIFSTS
jgi:hypothetical protein